MKRGKWGIDDDHHPLLFLLFHFTDAPQNYFFFSQVVEKELLSPSKTPVSDAEVADIKRQLMQSVYEVGTVFNFLSIRLC